jgi:hypothetical protein
MGVSQYQAEGDRVIVISVGGPRKMAALRVKRARLQNDRRAVIKWYRCPDK